MPYKLIFIILVSFFFSCSEERKVPEIEESPTSGKLKVFFDEGLTLHVNNQAYTFEGLYYRAKVNAVPASEEDAIRNLLNDSCKGIIINRLLGEKEKKAFEQRQCFPKYSALARTGVALIVNTQSDIRYLTTEQVKELLSSKLVVKDSLNRSFEPIAILDNKTSSITHYLLDSIIRSTSFGPKCSATRNSLELINTVASNPNAIGFIDFAWLSDRDDSLFKAYSDKIRFLAVGKDRSLYVEPNQSSFKTGEYPFTRTVYFLRNTGDFTLAKGFESFMAGPKGQLIFLKQGLLPHRQSERLIEVNLEPLGSN